MSEEVDEFDNTPRSAREEEEPPKQQWLAGFDTVDVDPDRDSWVTPKWIADAIGEWDLDPATNTRSHIRAKKTFMLERSQDGLALARLVGKNTRAFINPPYSRGMVIKFVRAYRHTNFCFLLRLDFSTEWFSELFPRIGMILVPRNQRVAFDAPPGAKASSTPFPHGLIYHRAEDVTPEIEKLCYPFAAIHRPLEIAP